jgi:hypothetical protein
MFCICREVIFSFLAQLLLSEIIRIIDSYIKLCALMLRLYILPLSAKSIDHSATTELCTNISLKLASLTLTHDTHVHH